VFDLACGKAFAGVGILNRGPRQRQQAVQQESQLRGLPGGFAFTEDSNTKQVLLGACCNGEPLDRGKDLKGLSHHRTIALELAAQIVEGVGPADGEERSAGDASRALNQWEKCRARGRRLCCCEDHLSCAYRLLRIAGARIRQDQAARGQERQQDFAVAAACRRMLATENENLLSGVNLARTVFQCVVRNALTRKTAIGDGHRLVSFSAFVLPWLRNQCHEGLVQVAGVIKAGCVDEITILRRLARVRRETAKMFKDRGCAPRGEIDENNPLRCGRRKRNELRNWSCIFRRRAHIEVGRGDNQQEQHDE
jgi:hypothetical protein